MLINNIYLQHTLQKLFLVLSLGLLGFFMTDLIVGITIIHFDGFIVQYVRHEQVYSEHKYKFIRT